MKKILLLFFAVFSLFPAFGQVSFSSSDIPVITINTYGKQIVDEPKIDAYMRIIDNGAGKRNSAADSANVFSGKIGIEIRGQSSQQFPKKPYGVETRDSDGNDLKVSIFGMPAESDWALYPSYSDKTLLRNALAFKLYGNLGRYGVRTRHCEVILNGEYIGVYVFMEKIKRDKGRVNIKKLESSDISGDALTGGYIIKIDKLDDGQNQGWVSSYRPPDNASKTITYLYTYPKQEDITAEQKNYIKQFFSFFEDLMNSPQYNEPFRGYYDVVNFSSFIDTYILFEFVKNVDSYRISTYFYKDRNTVDGRLCYGPVWDLDFGFGNANYDNGSSNIGWEVTVKNASDFLTPFWNRKLMNDPVFYNALSKRWSNVKNTVFSISEINRIIDSAASVIAEGRTRNFQKWNIMGKYVWPNAYIGNNYEDEIKYLKSWIQSRTNWLNSMLNDNFADVTWLTPESKYTTLTAGKTVKIPAGKLYSIVKNVDSVKYISEDGLIDFTVKNDTVSAYALSAGSVKIKGLAYRYGNVYDISPAIVFNVSGSDGVAEKEIKNAISFQLKQNYPNPFNPSTNFSLILSQKDFISVDIYDALGKKAMCLWNGVKEAGGHNFTFNALGFPSGVYFCRAANSYGSKTIKMLYLK
jgi:hypothetical protein